MNAGRKKLGTNDLSGKVFITSGLGGMSGAQAKAAVICGCIGVIAEVSEEALKKRHKQGWVVEITDDVNELLSMVKLARKNKVATSIGFLGNIVTVWERFLKEYKETGELLVELGSDQTSCHNPYNGGYYPVQLSFEEAGKVLAENPDNFKEIVQESLRRHISAINALSDAGMYFFDYGNAFLLEARRSGANVSKPGEDKSSTLFRYPSYVQDIMGDILSLGFGPFRWCCTSWRAAVLRETDAIAAGVLKDLMARALPEAAMQISQDWSRAIQRRRHQGRNNARFGRARPPLLVHLYCLLLASKAGAASTSGRANAVRFTTSSTRPNSVRSVRRNFRRAGVL